MKTCKSCGEEIIDSVFDAGKQPISSRYLKSHDEKEDLYNLELGQCLSCGLVQLIDPVPIEELQPIYKWITYNEPEGHLDDLVSQLSLLEGINRKSSILGISYKEDSTLARFASLGFANVERLPMPKKILEDFETVGVETVQNYISSETFNYPPENDPYDVILIRHILEHAYSPGSFLKSLKKLAHKNSYYIFEVPDCSLLFSSCDYTAIWEDHILYFTPSTFKAFLKKAGFSVLKYHLYPYPYENCLIIIARIDDAPRLNSDNSQNIETSRKLMINYGKNFLKNKDATREKLQQIKANFGDIAVFGAGHLSTMYLNVMNISDLISFVVDDDENKSGLFIPGCRLPIYNSKDLLEKKIKFCLTSLSPESEKKVIAANQEFLSRGGVFASIFPSSPNSFINST